MQDMIYTKYCLFIQYFDEIRSPGQTSLEKIWLHEVRKIAPAYSSTDARVSEILAGRAAEQTQPAALTQMLHPDP